MKKLMIAAAIVCAAAFAQAATVKWTAGNVYAGNATDKAGSGYSAYFIASACDDLSVSTYSLDKALADAAKGDFAFVSTYGQAQASFLDNKGAGTGGSQGATITMGAGNNESWTGYLVIIDAADIADATKAYITTEVTKATGTNGQQASLAFTANTGTQTASNWYAVPEPTSGLLLLLGVAGLALKRRRA